MNPDAILAKEPFPWQNYIFIGIVFAALVAAFFYMHPRKKKLHAIAQGNFDGKFGSYENFNGGFKSR